jgi:hypothetical protein
MPWGSEFQPPLSRREAERVKSVSEVIADLAKLVLPQPEIVEENNAMKGEL